MTRFAKLLQEFFAVWLIKEREASPNTIASYRDCFRLLLEFLQQKLHKAPSELELEDLDAPVIREFLQYLEEQRGNGPRTRNARLAAIRAFFRYVAFQEPQLSALIQRVLAIPTKRWEKKDVDFLTREEVQAILEVIDTSTWAGQRDRALLALLAQTGLRVSEGVALRCEDIRLGQQPHVCCQGKGRKQRCVPVRRELAQTLSDWLKGRGAQPSDPLFPNARGDSLSRDGVAYLLKKHVTVACQTCPTLADKRVSPHVLRHTLAMDLLYHGVDQTVIALWLGHESVESTQCYLHANLKLKQKILDKTAPWDLPPGRYRPPDSLLAFLDSLVMPSKPGWGTRNLATSGGPEANYST